MGGKTRNLYANQSFVSLLMIEKIDTLIADNRLSLEYVVFGGKSVRKGENIGLRAGHPGIESYQGIQERT